MNFSIKRQIETFINGINNTPYAVVGSGQYALNILELVKKYDKQQPIGWFDDRNINLEFSPHKVQSIDEIPDHIPLIIASENYAENIRHKLRGSGKSNIAFSLNEIKISVQSASGESQKNSEGDGIIINTIPKCGNAYIAKTLTKSLGLEFTYVCGGPWPGRVISQDLLAKLTPGHTFSVDHIDVTEYNLSVLRDANIKKMLVHIRDPRQATLSWLHWIDKKFANNTISTWEIPTGDKHYFSLPISKKIDILIDEFLTGVVDFVDRWIKVSEEEDFDIQFTDFSTMKDTPDVFFDTIKRHFNVPVEEISFMQASTEKSHYRKGLLNEWADVFTQEQQEKCAKLIPEAMKKRFDWLSD